MSQEPKELATKSRTRARQKFGTLEEPNPTPNDAYRDQWINDTYTAFVTIGKNKEYYRVILQLLWPKGHGIPGPVVTDTEIRNAIDAYRRSKAKHGDAIKPYHDPFRRVRELMGEEALTGIIRSGAKTQLVRLEIGQKRKPRTSLTDEVWEHILEKYGRRCPSCGRSEPEISFDQDHKIPRSRNGGDELENWQPLCFECNNHKSMACRGCSLDCLKCPWAFPEKFARLRIKQTLDTQIRLLAHERSQSPSDLLNEILAKHLSEKSIEKK